MKIKQPRTKAIHPGALRRSVFVSFAILISVLVIGALFTTYPPINSAVAQTQSLQDLTKIDYLRSHTYSYTLLKRSISKIGTKGQDVFLVKKILNDSPDTRIAQSGVDSIGKETDSFTLPTYQAIQKFQNKYKLLLAKGTSTIGNVSGSTLTKFDELLNKKYGWGYLRDAAFADLPTKTLAEKELILRLEDLFKGYPEEKILSTLKTGVTSTKTNTTVNLYGVGFSHVSGPAVTWGGLVVPLDVINNYKAQITIPYNAPLGTVTLTATSTDKTVLPSSIGQSLAKITLTRGVKPIVAPIATSTTTELSPSAPNLFSVKPERGIIGTTVTVTGNNFTPTGNTVWTPYGTVENIPSPDGKTLTFKMDFKPLWEFRRIRFALEDEDDEHLMPTHFQYQFGVYNANGGSNQHLLFDVVIRFK